MANLWYVGLILAVFASMAGTIGKQLIRFSNLQEQKGRASLAATSMVVAMALMTAIGPLIDMGSYAFAPQSLIAPLGSLDVVWNTMLAPLTLGEVLNKWLVAGCVFIASGALTTSMVGTHEDKTYTIADMKDTFIRKEVLIYLISLFVFVSVNIGIPMQVSKGPKEESFVPGSQTRGLALGITAGSIAGNMFCVKAFVELVQISIKENDGSVWLHWLPYTMLVGAVFFALSNLHFVTKGMKEYEALFMGSIFEGSLIFFACVSGGVVFKEFEVFTVWEFLIYCIALFSIICGIFAVAKGTTPENDVEDEASPTNKSETHSINDKPSRSSRSSLDASPFRGSVGVHAKDLSISNGFVSFRASIVSNTSALSGPSRNKQSFNKTLATE